MLKVIIVDDEQFIAQGLQALIDWNAAGYEVAAVLSDGQEALEYIKKLPVDLVITDVMMPKMTGLEFLETVRRENLSNALLSNEIIAEKMAVSPSTLVRRIRRLLDTSPNNYVRNLRLVVAAEMLREPHGNNISEICYAVGFSNVSYFAKCFREMYGKTPTVFAEEMRGKESAPAET